MKNKEGSKTEKSYWEASHGTIRNRLPSRLNVDVLNIMRLLRKHVKPGNRYIEIGCAPGKMLAIAASVLKAEAYGLDYSEPGIEQCHMLFNSLGLKVSLYHVDFFNHTLTPESYDVVASFGVIEHFNDPRIVVQKHIELIKPGGVVLIVIPNYGGIYGSLQRWFDEPNLSLHNLEIMNVNSLIDIVNSNNVESIKAYPFGNISPWIISLDKRFPRFIAKAISLGINAIGLVQPFGIKLISPMIVLEIHKRQIV